MRTPGIQSYRQHPPEGDYDAILIGSGMGCMTCAALMARAGRRPLVLERHYTAGGFTHSYDRNGYEWDVGVHYIGDMGAKHTMARRLFDYVTDDQLEWAAMDPVYDRLFIGDRQIDLVAGPKAFADNLKQQFPGEEQAIDTYLDYLGQVAKAMPGESGAEVGFFPVQRHVVQQHGLYQLIDVVCRRAAGGFHRSGSPQPELCRLHR